MLTPRWTKLRPHAEQWRLWNSTARFKLVGCGRRSGKSEVGIKRDAVRRCLQSRLLDGRFIIGAPTRRQARDIFWSDLKRLSPPNLVAAISDGELWIRYVHGPTLYLYGMDEPARIEGSPIDYIWLDEFAKMKPQAWESHVLPALSTTGRHGGASLVGTPKGRNHFWQLWTKFGTHAGVERFSWPSSGVIDPDELAWHRAHMDPTLFKQEFEGSFVSFGGRVYYQFDRDFHVVPFERATYMHGLPVAFCFDFNVKPGVAVIVQEQPGDPLGVPGVSGSVTVVLGEVWIEDDSNTPRVCGQLIRDWAHVCGRGEVHLYGDASGGARGTSQVMGSDWDIIKAMLRPHFPFLRDKVASANPEVRARINAMNGRLRAADGTVRMLISNAAPHVVEDLDGVLVLEGSNGEIDKKSTPMLTHLTDALGYYVWQTTGARYELFVDAY